jgi:hypothetical protein
MTQPILITGIPRSGATSIAAAINACGAFGGTMSKRGMYSNDTIREMLMKPYLDRMDVDVEGQYPLPITKEVKVPDLWRQMVEGILVKEGYKRGAWMYKDARIALTWPLWNISFPDAKWIIVRRRTGDIVQSCIKTGYMRAFKNPAVIKELQLKSEADGWLWFVHEYEKRIVEMIDKINHKVIWPERMVNGDFKQMHELCEWLGLTWNEDALQSVKKLLWGGNQERN